MSLTNNIHELDDVSLLLARLDGLIIDEETGDALELAFDDANEDLVKLGAMDFIHWIAGYVVRKPGLFERNQDCWQCLESILDYVVRLGKPKELLLGLLSNVDSYGSALVTDVHTFNLWLRELRWVVLQLAHNLDYLKWALSSLSDCLSRLPIWDSVLLEPNEVIILENSEQVQLAIAAFTLILEFVSPFIIEATACTRKMDSRNDWKLLERRTIITFILKILERPLSRMDLRLPVSSGRVRAADLKSELHFVVERLTECIFRCFPFAINSLTDSMGCQTLSLSNQYSESGGGVSQSATDVGVGCFAYLHFSLELNSEYLVCVMTHLHRFDQILPCIAALLQLSPAPDENRQEKGIALSEKFVSLLKAARQKIATQQMHLPPYQRVFLGLLGCTACCRLESRRNRALDVFKLLFDMFELEGQVMFTRLVFAIIKGQAVAGLENWSPSDNGISAFMIDYYRQKLADGLSLQEKNLSPGPFWRDLPGFMALFLSLPDGINSDLLQDFTRIMAGLNFIKYLGLVRKNGRNDSLSDTSIIWCEQNFLVPLGEALKASKHECSTDVNRHESELSSLIGQSSNSSQRCEESDKLDFLQSAHTSLDMMDCVLCSVTEILEQLLIQS